MKFRLWFGPYKTSVQYGRIFQKQPIYNLHNPLSVFLPCHKESTSHAEKEHSYLLFALYLIPVFVGITLYRVFLNSVYES
jgi:hypothetical protein